jgi:FkbM family methyltransferase
MSFSEYYSYRAGVSPAELLLLRRIGAECEGKGVGFDVGANVGLFTCAMGDCGFAEVHSFEPIPETFVRLKQNVIANGLLNLARLNCMAVSDRRGLARFAVSHDSPGVNRLATAMTPFPHSIQNVASITLDDYCEEFGVTRIDMAKVDVEGMEELVLRGASNLLTRRGIKSILIEISPVNQPQVGLSIDSLIQQIIASGYQAHKLLPDGTSGEELSGDYLRGCLAENVLLIPAVG